MQAVERADAKARAVAASQIRAKVENTFRHFYFDPQAGRPIVFKMAIQLLCHGSGDLAMEDVLSDGVGTFRVMKGSKPNWRGRDHAPSRFRRVLIGGIQRNDEAGIRVNRQ